MPRMVWPCRGQVDSIACVRVQGVFELRDGKIAVWRDYFDWSDLTRSTVRGIARLNRRFPLG